jgi:hypothetical protein
MEKVKENVHILLIVNLLLSLILVVTNQEVPSFIVVGNSNQPKENLRKIICESAFYSWKEGKLSSYYMHPEIVEAITEDLKFELDKTSELYFKMQGREICQVVAKTKEGLKSFEAVIGINGPLMYQVTSLRSRKPQFKEIKEYL